MQSIERGLDLLERMADAGGEVTLTELVRRMGLPMPTIHRLMRTLVDRGYVRQEPSRRYALAPRLTRLGESASRLLNVWVRPQLENLVCALSETANMALLARLDPAQAREIVMRTGMPAQTPRIITDSALGAPALTAISISGPEARLTPSVVDRAVPLLQEVARRLSTELSYDDATV